MSTWLGWLLYSIVNLCVGFAIGVDFERGKKRNK